MRGVRLADTVGEWFGRVEVVLGGAEIPLRDGQEALAAGDSSRARACALELLSRVPGSPIGLALLADAAEMAGLDGEHREALEELATRTPSRADVWVRLGHARLASCVDRTARSADAPSGGGEGAAREALARGLAVAAAGSEERRDALLALADLDLGQGEPERAELWLERLAGAGAGERAADAAMLRAEARIARGDGKRALAELKNATIEPTDARANLVLGRAHAMAGDAAAFTPLLRATILDARGASEALSSALGWIPSDEATRARVRDVVAARGEAGLARWRAAFARAEGRRDEARAALVEAVKAGDAHAARPLLEAALDDHDAAALGVAVGAFDGASAQSAGRSTPGAAEDETVRDARVLVNAGAADDAQARGTLDELAALTTPRAAPWAKALRETVARAWIPEVGPARWELVLARLEYLARALHDLEASARIASLSAERRRPLRVAIVGEFNAGKSTFINALVGQEIAPMGILPTTATLHHLRYAPDPIARILFVPEHEPRERIVPVGELRATLKTVDAAAVRRVEILLPLAYLTRVEILDTPGFNAPDEQHTAAARGAFEETDVALWLLDAAQPLKKTERDALDDARAARLPVQVLVNKADRLAPHDRARVLASVREGLDESGLPSFTEPLLFSARRALAGKLGDAAALAESGWAEVEAMLEREMIARSDELKERALRRRALAIVATLGQAAARAADDERARDEARRQRRERIAHAAARIDGDAETVASRLAASLAKPAAAWHADLALVVAGRDPESLAADASLGSLASYRVDRALSHLARPLAHALAGAADGTGVAPGELGPVARALVRAFASVAGPATPVLPLARSAVAALVEHLLAVAATPRAPESARAAALVGELAALAGALG
jgi:small GTP-binding protein